MLTFGKMFILTGSSFGLVAQLMTLCLFLLLGGLEFTTACFASRICAAHFEVALNVGICLVTRWFVVSAPDQENDQDDD